VKPFGRAAFMLLLANVLAPQALAQNGYSFIDAAKSPLNYRLGGVAPRVACRDLARLSDGHVTILSAEVTAAAGDVPEFCRVLGIIHPEVKFEVALPTSWNRRLYMRGNGGYAGESLDAPAPANEDSRRGNVNLLTKHARALAQRFRAA